MSIVVTRRSPLVTRQVVADVTNSSGVTNADVTNISFPIGAGETWSFEANLQIGCSGSGGVNFAMQIPSGANHRTIVTGMGATSTAIASTVLTGIASSSNLNTVVSANGWVRISGTVTAGANSGTVQLRFKSGTDTQTSTVFAGSYLTARRITP